MSEGKGGSGGGGAGAVAGGRVAEGSPDGVRDNATPAKRALGLKSAKSASAAIGCCGVAAAAAAKAEDGVVSTAGAIGVSTSGGAVGGFSGVFFL